MPDIRTPVLARWRVLLSTIVTIATVPWFIGFCLRHRCRPIALAYVSARSPAGMDPSQSKQMIFTVIEKHDPTLAALYPRRILVPARLGIDDRARLVREFMREHALGFPIAAKPDCGSRSFGAYRVDGEAGLRHLLERISIDYLVEEFCEGPIEAALFFVRSPDGVRSPLYGVAVKHHAYVCASAPHPELTSFRTRFLCADETARLTPALQQTIDAFAGAVPFDMGRLDVRAPSVELLLAEPRRMKVLEVNVGFTVADLHVTDLRHRFATRLRMTIRKWEYATRLGSGYYGAAPRRIRLKESLADAFRHGVAHGSMYRNLYRSKSRNG